MPNRLNLPEELNSLIEKREQENRRQQEVDEQTTNKPDADETAAEVERRSGKDRRANES